MRRRECIALVGIAIAVAIRGAARSKPSELRELASWRQEVLTTFVAISTPSGKDLANSGTRKARTFSLSTEPAMSSGFQSWRPNWSSLGVDVILATNSLAARAAKQATSSIPLVVPVMGDPVGDELVASLARPCGNITGLTFLGPELLPKRLVLLKETLPTASRIAALLHPRAYGEHTMDDMMNQIEAAARTLGVQLQIVAVRSSNELDQAFSAIAADRADALIVFPSPMLFSEWRRIVDLATRYRLPSMAVGREFVEHGGLIAYGANIPDLHRRAATHVDKILRGAKPAELPVEQPTKFELVINLKTAKALNITVPSSLRIRADELIE
jgi:putative ABC transport system substrate-binding protein